MLDASMLILVRSSAIYEWETTETTIAMIPGDELFRYFAFVLFE
jgi:hypothetical protein